MIDKIIDINYILWLAEHNPFALFGFGILIGIAYAFMRLILR